MSAFVVLFALVGAACDVVSPTASPTPTLPGEPVVVMGETSEQMVFTVSVYDTTSHLAQVVAVSAAVTEVPLTNPVNEGISAVHGNAKSLYVAWVARSCEDRPALQLSDRGNGLLIILDRGQRREGPCPDYPHYFALRLDFDRIVHTETTTLEVVG